MIERESLKLTFDENPTVTLTAPRHGVNSWLDEGEMTIALTGEGRRASFDRPQVEFPSPNQKRLLNE
jgi:hypothetical protein